MPLLVGNLITDVTNKSAFVPFGAELCCLFWWRRHFFDLSRPLLTSLIPRETVLSCILIAGDAVTISEVNVDVVPSMSRPAAADCADPLGRRHLRVPATGNVILVGEVVSGDNVALDVSSVSEGCSAQGALELATIPHGVFVRVFVSFFS